MLFMETFLRFIDLAFATSQIVRFKTKAQNIAYSKKMQNYMLGALHENSIEWKNALLSLKK